jgi:hypothetical protein
MRNFLVAYEGEDKILDEKELQETKVRLVRSMLDAGGSLRTSELYYNRGNYKFWAAFYLQQEGIISNDGFYWYIKEPIKAMLLYA